MANYGFNGLNNNFGNETSLAQLLRQFAQPQPESLQTANEPQQTTSKTTSFEVNSESDLEYIEPQKTGSLQMVYCRPEKRVYAGRYNFSTQKTDWEAFLSEGEVKSSQKNDATAEMGQIVHALALVVDKLNSMDNKIEGLKRIEPEIEKPIKDIGRQANGQFKKKGES